VAEPIDPAKLRALREALDRDGKVSFRNGSVVETWKAGAAIGVIRPGNARYTFGPQDVEGAYRRALEAPPNTRSQPTGDPAKYGDEPPW
jgi:hypothetical protein